MQTVKQLYDKMGEGEILQAFSGVIGKSDVDKLLSYAESKIKDVALTKTKEKRVYSLYIECLQNLFHHISKDCPSCKQKGIILLTNNNETFNIITSNYVDNDKVEVFSKQLDKLNTLRMEEIKQLYKNSLENNGYSEKGGGGLGLW